MYAKNNSQLLFSPKYSHFLNQFDPVDEWLLENGLEVSRFINLSDAFCIKEID